MINNLISINVVIQEIVRDLGLGNSNIPFSDIKEWIIEGLKHIGVKAQFREEIRDISIENYTGKLPCETYKVSELINMGCYKYNPNLTIDDDDKDREKTINELSITSSDYNIQFQEITTSFKTGSMRFKLLLLPLDKNGYLLIPDSVSYKDALMWKIAYHCSIRGHKFPQPAMNDMRYNKSMWNFYCKQARGVARQPDRIMMELLKNQFTTFIINPHQYINNFNHVNSHENLRLDNNTIR